MTIIRLCGIQKLQYLLNEQKVLEKLISAMIQAEKGNSTKYHCDIEDYYS